MDKMSKFLKHINVGYPPGNSPIFEEWLYDNFSRIQTDRKLIPVHFTSYFVNNGYGHNKQALQDLQLFVDSLDRSQKWVTVVQYDDGVLVDFKDLDVLQFNMSQNVGIEMPLLCQPQPYKFHSQKKWLANFVGSKTHPIRESANSLLYHPDYYVSFQHHDIETYCRIIHESVFTLCYRGYGRNSFRIAEALQYGSVPVYISDEFINCFDANFEDYGIIITHEDQHRISEILESVPIEDVIKKQSKLKEVYQTYYTFEGVFNQIKKILEKENAPKG